MKKSDAYSYVVYFLILLGAVLLGLFVLRPVMAAYSGPINITVVAVVSFVITLIVLPILYELAHVLGAKAGGYEVLSVNVLYFNFYKKPNKKWSFRFKTFNGLTGETIVAPKERKNGKPSNPKPMLWFGNMLFFILLLTFILMFISYGKGETSIMKTAFCMAMIIVVLLLFYNILPIELDSKTDGYQLKLISKQSDILVYNELLRLQACDFLGKDKGEIKIFSENITDFAAQIDRMSVYEYIKQAKYYEAIKLLDMILAQKDNIHYNVGLNIIAEKLFLLLYSSRLEDAKNYYNNVLTSDEKRDISNSGTMPCIRSYILISTYIDPSESEIQYATSKADKAYKQVEDAYKDIEKTLYKGTLEKVKTVHPDWQLISSETNKNDEE